MNELTKDQVEDLTYFGRKFFGQSFLAGTLLYLNNRREWIGALANGKLGNSALVVCLLAFGAVCIREVVRVLGM
jgi:hypothetical protein